MDLYDSHKQRIYIGSNYGFDTSSPAYIGQDRDRYIILFNQCKLSSTKVTDICTEMESYIHQGENNANGINVMMINQGVDGFSGETDQDDYILCLTEYDQGRIYTRDQRDFDLFDQFGLEDTIEETICKREPTANPTIDGTPSPTPEPSPMPTLNPTPEPSSNPTPAPSSDPTIYPTMEPTIMPSNAPATEDPTR